MKDLRSIIAANICELRTDAGLTQMKLADILNYSDKAVSKWERGEAIPDITVLKSIADYFGVGVDYLLEQEHGERTDRAREFVIARKKNRIFIACISVLLVFLVATVAFSVLTSIGAISAPWIMYIYALPVSSTLILVFNCVWGRRKLNYLIVTLLMWTAILSAYLTLLIFLDINFWLLFVIGAPMQVILLFLPGISFVKYRTDRRKPR